jgi:hypothetical protein
MKRFLGITAVLALVVAPACDDGPTQTFKGATPNGGGDTPFTDPTNAQNLGGSTQGRTPLIPCTPEKQRKVWASELAKPIVPIRGAAGLDGTVNLTYTGLSIDKVEEALCQSTGFNTTGCQTNNCSAYGSQGELGVNWSTSTRLVSEFDVFTGYEGTLAFTDPVTNDKFTISMQAKAIDRNGQPMHFNWFDTTTAGPGTTHDNVQLLYNALVRVYDPTEAATKAAAGNDCFKAGQCLAVLLGGVTGAIAIVPLAFLQIYYDNSPSDPVGRDLPTRIYLPIQKKFKFTGLPVTMALPGTADALGARISGTIKDGTKTSTCTFAPGVTYNDFLNNCVLTSADANTNTTTLNKFLSGLTHNDEIYRIDVVGTDPEFNSLRVAASPDPATINDGDKPDGNDPIGRIVFDEQLAGPIVNDFAGEDPKGAQDNHGFGLVNLAYAILTQQALDAADTTGRAKHPIGDVKCTFDFAYTTTAQNAGCTGMEGYVTSADPASAPAFPNNALGSFASDVGLVTQTGLTPQAGQVASWDDSPGNGVFRDAALPPWAASAQRVIKILGKGQRTNVPVQFREPRNYSVIWMQALTQYMLARGNVGSTVTITDVLAAGPGGTAAHKIDPDHFFFDTGPGGAQQFDTAEFVYTDFATAKNPWYDVRIVTDALSGILSDIEFDNIPQRGERALLGAVGATGAKLGESDTLLQTNLFGSSVLSTLYKEPATPAAPYLTAWDCATADTEKLTPAQLTAYSTACGDGNGPLVDAAGKIIRQGNGDVFWKRYPGAFASTASALNLGRNILTVPQDELTVTVRNSNLLQAKITFKTFLTPFDSSKPGPDFSAPVGYELLTDFTGFFIPINASRDRFVREEIFDFTGDALNTEIGTVEVLQGGVAVKGLNRLASANSNDFLGSIPVCASAPALINGSPPARPPWAPALDVLTVKMFTPSAVVLDWINSHPNSITDCNLIIDYASFGIALSRVTSIANGVIVNFTDPIGIVPNENNTEVSDVDLFATGL